jgi:uncharacterized protein YoaH (UPF0181 family)
MNKATVDLQLLSKEQIIALVMSGAITSGTEQHREQEVVEQKEHPPKAVKTQQKRKRKSGYMQSSTKQQLEKIKAELKKARVLDMKDIGKLIGVTPDNIVRKYLRPCKWAKVDSVMGVGTKIYASRLLPLDEPEQEQKPMAGDKSKRAKKHNGKSKHKLTKYQQFRQVRMGELMREGKSMKQAHDIVINEWREQKRVSPASASFPVFESISEQWYPILEGILRRCITNNETISYRDVQYPLGLLNMHDYRQFVDDVIANSSAIKKFFGVTEGSFRYDGNNITFR